MVHFPIQDPFYTFKAMIFRLLISPHHNILMGNTSLSKRIPSCTLAVLCIWTVACADAHISHGSHANGGKNDTVYIENRLNGNMSAVFYRADNPYRLALPVSIIGKDKNSIIKLVCNDTLILYDSSLVPFVVLPGEHLVAKTRSDGSSVLELAQRTERTNELLFFSNLFKRLPILTISKEKIYSSRDFLNSERAINQWHGAAVSFLSTYGKTHTIGNWFKEFALQYFQNECLLILFDPFRFENPQKLGKEIRRYATRFISKRDLSFFNFRIALYNYNTLLASQKTRYPGFDELYESALKNFTGPGREELIYRVLINYAEDEIYKS
ncbi:MAG TPA: hypothetical protein VKR32_00045, partial [Puia sp.]|nr:hypothetical protein [Puia sp.]